VSVNTPTKTFGIGAGHASNVKNLELAARTIAKVRWNVKLLPLLLLVVRWGMKLRCGMKLVL